MIFVRASTPPDVMKMIDEVFPYLEIDFDKQCTILKKDAPEHIRELKRQLDEWRKEHIKPEW